LRLRSQSRFLQGQIYFLLYNKYAINQNAIISGIALYRVLALNLTTQGLSNIY